VGTLFPTLKKPVQARVQLTLLDGNVRTRQIVKADWKRPFRKLKQRFYTICRFENLTPGKRYAVTFSRRIEKLKDVFVQDWQALKGGTFDTLPSRLPLKGKKPFTLGLGSCFYNHCDGGSIF